MKRIKKFNESAKPETAWCVMVTEVGGFAKEDESKCFYNQMHAADYFIEYVNDYCEQDFEPFFDNEGERFFTSVDENEDFEMAMTYVEEHSQDIDIVILELPLFSTISKDGPKN